MFDNLARWHRDEVEAAKLLGEQRGEQIGIKAIIEVLSSFGVGKKDTIEIVSAKFAVVKKKQMIIITCITIANR